MKKHLYLSFIALLLSSSSPMIVGSQNLMPKEEKETFDKKSRTKKESDYKSNDSLEDLKRGKSSQSIPSPPPIIDFILDFFTKDVYLFGEKALLPNELTYVINLYIEGININVPSKQEYINIVKKKNNLLIKKGEDNCWLKVVENKTFPIRRSERITDFFLHEKDFFGIIGEKRFLIEKEKGPYYLAKEQVELVNIFKEPNSPFYRKKEETYRGISQSYGFIERNQLGKYQFISKHKNSSFRYFKSVIGNIFFTEDEEDRLWLLLLNSDGLINKKNMLELGFHSDSKDRRHYVPKYVKVYKSLFVYLFTKPEDKGWYRVEVGKDKKFNIIKREAWKNYHELIFEDKKIIGFTAKDEKRWLLNDVITKKLLLEPIEQVFLAKSDGFFRKNNLLFSYESCSKEEDLNDEDYIVYSWIWFIIAKKEKKRILPEELKLKPKNLVSINNHIFGTSSDGYLYKLSIEEDPKFVKIANSLDVEGLIQIGGKIIGDNGEEWLEYDDSKNQFIDSEKYKNYEVAEVSVPNGMEMINMELILSHDVAEYTIK